MTTGRTTAETETRASIEGVESRMAEEIGRSTSMGRENLLTLFEKFQRFGGGVAVVQKKGYRREEWTYEKLAGSAVSIALMLKERGVRTGDRVLLWGPNSAEWIAAFWGCLLRGAVAVPIDDGATAEFWTRVVGDAGAKLAFVSREKLAVGSVIPRLVLEDLADSAMRPGVHVTAWQAGQPKTPLYQTLGDEPVTRRHIAQILYTSGTTGEPRGVVLTHGNFLANIEPLEKGIAPYRKYERWMHPLRFISLVPLSHVFGQFMALFVPPLIGATVVFEPSQQPMEIVRTIKRERATALIAVPRMLQALGSALATGALPNTNAVWLEGMRKSTTNQKFLRRAWSFRRIHRRFGWRFWAFISGGAAMPAELEDFFKSLGFAVVQGYGMTETASLISLNHPFRSRQGTIGKILPGREFKIADDGEILVRGENVSTGYWQQGGFAVATGEKDGWLRTGDLGELDAEGNLRFRGRKKNVIVASSGLNIYPEDLERAVRTHPAVRDCVVIPIESGGNAEPCGVILLKVPPDAPAHAAAMQETILLTANGSLAEYQQIRRAVVWPEHDFPRTATGKPKLGEITQRARELLDGNARRSHEAGSRTASSADLGDLLARFSSSSSAATHLEQNLNLTSLDRVELLSALEQRFQVELDEAAFSSAKTVRDVERLVLQPGHARSDYVYPRWTQREPVRWLRLVVYYALVWPATQILGHPKTVGRENLRGVRGPVLVISNHTTRRADMGLILAGLPLRFRHRLATAMGGESLQRMRRPPSDWFFAKRWAYRIGYGLVTALFNVFPLPQFSGFRESFRFAGDSVDRGYSVLIFPEGEVNNSEDGHMAPFQPGVGLLAENLNMPVVPMRLDGVWKMKREGRRLARAGEITVRIGAPVTFAPGTAPEEIARRCEALVRDL